MAKIRAYKLAEEFGIDKNDFVEKARTLGVQLKSSMVALEPEDVEKLRAKLGGAVEAADVDEHRVEGRTGSAILRRRKRKVEPPPKPEPVVPPIPVVAKEAEAEAEIELTPTELEPIAEPEAEVELSLIPVPELEPAPSSPAPGKAEPEPTAARKRSSAAVPAPVVAEQPAADRKGRQRKRVREVVSLLEQDQVKLQFTSRGGPPRRPAPIVPRAVVNPRSRRRDKLARPVARTAASEQPKTIRVEGEISVGELAKLLGVKAPVIQGKLMALGTMVSMNQNVDVEACRKVASELGHEVVDTGFKEEEYLDVSGVDEEEEGAAANLQARFAVITVMGHVDHGKTSLLDAIRKTKVTEGEAGGITQHIGAYQVRSGDSLLTFIDTPGHEAFTAMRARGAAVTDIVVLVVAATEGVMPQTVEAIEHAKAAGCPILVAVNKCDLPGADPQQTKRRLMEHGLVPEEFGGDVICADVSAKTGAGLDHLLEMLSLQAELLELEGDPNRRAKGVTLEASLSKGRGPVATVLIREGTLRRGDVVVADREWGRVRIMEDDEGRRVKQAGPSVPVQVVGLSGVPSAGSIFTVVENERVAKRIVGHRDDKQRSQVARPRPRLTLEEFFARTEGKGAKELSVVLKADVQGTCEAVRTAIEKLSTDEVTLNVLSAGVGGIAENDVMLASASDAIVVGFGARPDPAARRAAEDHGVEIRVYSVIYELVDDVKSAMAGLLPPIVNEVTLGRAEVRESFSIPKLGTIAGSYITEGSVRRNVPCRLIRDGIQIYQGTVGSLRRFKEDVREVKSGFECGIGIEGYNDVKIGDVIEAFELEERAATL